MRRALPLLLAVWMLGEAPAATARDLTPKIQQHVLNNGLRVYLLEDHSAPLFTFQYWVEVGSGDEWEGRPGVTGLSHFFEHLMFKGTERYPDFFKEISSRGGKLNAFTWLDVTVYWDKLVTDELEFVLDIESDRLKHMRVDFLAIEPEREVVKSERLMRTENKPSGALSEAVSATLFKKHSYHWSTVGWMRDLNAITIEQARAYHARFYVPNNAFIVLVGDFQPKEALKLIRKYYGGFEKKEVKREARAPEPPQTAERRVFVEKPVGTGLMNVTYRAPAGKHADYLTLDVVKQLLVGGKTSRLQSALVHSDDPVARSVSGFMFPFVDEGVLSLEVRMLPGKANLDAERRITAQIKRLCDEPVPTKELARAVAQLRADTVRGMATTHSRAQLIGFSVRGTGDPAFPWKALETYGKVTPADVQRVANRWLQPSSRVIGHAVDPRRLVALSRQLGKEHPSKIDGLDALLAEAMAFAASAEAFRKDVAAAAVEKKAIILLEARAKVALLAAKGDKALLEKLDAYLGKAAKGTVKRKEQLAKRLAGHDKRAAALEDKRVALAGRWKTISAQAKAGRRLAWAGHLVHATPFRGVGEPTGGDAGLAEWALHALSIRHFGGLAIQDIAAKLAKRDPKDGVLRAVREFAHTAQSVDAGRM